MPFRKPCQVPHGILTVIAVPLVRAQGLALSLVHNSFPSAHSVLVPNCRCPDAVPYARHLPLAQE